MEAFATLAEVAVGVAGFGSVAIVLAREEGWSGSDLFRVSSFLMASLGALLLSLLPIGLAGSSLSDTAALQLTSAALLVFSGAFMTVNLRMRRRHLDPSLYFGTGLMLLLGVTAVLNVGAQLASVAGPWVGSVAAPFFGVVWILGYACLVLVRILFFRPSPNKESS